MKPRPTEPVPRLALTLDEAAASVGVSLKTFRRHVLPHIRVVHVGAARMVPSRELERYLERAAQRPLARDSHEYPLTGDAA